VAEKWTRVQSVLDEAGWLAALGLDGRVTTAGQAAEDEAVTLRRLGARVLRDLGGRPCVRDGDPAVIAWRAVLDGRVAAAGNALDEATEAARHG
jgi:hypothetical protein